MSDPGSIRPEERFDTARVSAFLRSRLPAVVGDGPIQYLQFHGGKANLTYLARAGEVELVLRRAPLGEVAPGAHDMAREYRVLSALWSAYPKAPRALAMCSDPGLMGKPFFVMERRRGTVVREAWPDDLAPPQRRLVAEALVDAIAELHGIDPSRVGLEDLGRPEGFVARQVAGWTDRWQRAATRPLAAMDEVATLLAGGVPASQRATILHNDFKLDNVMIDGTGRIEAVLDWDMATIGDPLVDLGTALAYWPGEGDVVAGVYGARAPLLVPYLSKEEVANRYAAATGIDLGDLPYHVGLAYFRIAVIVEQIYARYVAGQTSDERFAPLGALTPLLAAAALEALRAQSSP